MEEQPKSYIRLGRFVLLLLILVFLSSLFFKGPFKQWLEASTFNFVFRSRGLSQIVQHNLSGKKGDFAVLIEDLKDGEKYSQRQDEAFPSASLYKLYLMAVVLKEVEDGKLKMEDGISSTKTHLVNVYGSIDSGYEDAPENISYSIEEALTRVGRISDNFAAIMLMDELGVEKVQNMADSLGKDTHIKSPTTTTASDIGLFFKKLYSKEIVNANVSLKLVEFLSLNQLNDRIPAGLPEGVKIIHKTGELARVRHDAGLVFLPNDQAYIIVLMSQNLKYEDDTVETFAKISKEVYEYFQAKQ